MGHGLGGGFALPTSAHGIAERTPILPISMAEGRFVGFPPGGSEGVDSGLAEVGDVNGDGSPTWRSGCRRPIRAAAGTRASYGCCSEAHPWGGSTSAPPRLAGFRILGPPPRRRRPAPVFAPDSPPDGAMAGTSVAGRETSTATDSTTSWWALRMWAIAGARFPARCMWCSGSSPDRPFYLARLEGEGYRIDGPDRGSAAGYAVAGPGDVSGDGSPDVVFEHVGRGARGAWTGGHGAGGPPAFEGQRLRDPRATPRLRRGGRGFRRGGLHRGRARRYRGRCTLLHYSAPAACRRDVRGLRYTTHSPGRVVRLGGRGVRIDGDGAFGQLGAALAPIGDLNGDGRSGSSSGVSGLCRGPSLRRSGLRGVRAPGFRSRGSTTAGRERIPHPRSRPARRPRRARSGAGGRVGSGGRRRERRRPAGHDRRRPPGPAAGAAPRRAPRTWSSASPSPRRSTSIASAARVMRSVAIFPT